MNDTLFTIVFLVIVAAPALGVFFLTGKGAPLITRIVIGLCVAIVTWILLTILINVSTPLMNGKPVSLYVVTPEAKAARFTAELGAIATRHGLAATPGQTTDDEGSTAYSLSATGQGLRLWSTNIPLTGQEDVARCGQYDQAHADPGQYAVTISPVLFEGSHEQAQSLLADVSNDLKAAGYQIEPAPVMCSPLSKAHAHTR